MLVLHYPRIWLARGHQPRVIRELGALYASKVRRPHKKILDLRVSAWPKEAIGGDGNTNQRR